MEREFLAPGSTQVRAAWVIWDPDKPNAQIKLETAVRLGASDIDRRAITLLARELKWFYEQTVGKSTKVVAEVEVPERKKPGPKPKNPVTATNA